MRVLKVTQSYYPFLDRGGPAVKVRAIARELARRGDRVTVLTSDLGIQEILHKDETLVRERQGWRSQKDSVETLYLSIWSRYRSITWNPGVFAFCRDRLPSFDVVHIYGFYDLLGPIVARACRRCGVPYVIEPMGMFRPIVRNVPLKWAYRYILGDSLVWGAQRVIATSPQEQTELIEEGIPHIKIIVRRNGIAIPKQFPAAGTFRRQWHIAESARLILFLGRLITKKSPELILEAFARWQAAETSGQSAILVLAGPTEKDNYREKLQAYATRLGLGKTVLFTGPLYDDAKWSAFRDADLFVLPSQNENFGNTAAEAVACGTPVLVTDRCGIAPLIEGRAGIVVPHECDALTAALGQLMSDGELYGRLQQGCAEVARDLDWEEPIDAMRMLYAQVVRKETQS